MKEKSLKRIDSMLDEAIEYIKESKFYKAKPDGMDTKFLIDHVAEMCVNKSPDKEEKALARKILKVSNSFFQYSDDAMTDMSLRLIPDALYNVLVKKYGEAGTYDGAYVPKDLEKKTSEYQELTSNLDKAYRFYDTDEIPDGVKEKVSVEEFIDDIYKELDLKKDEELELEMTPKIDGVSVNSSVKKAVIKETLTRGSVINSGKDKGSEKSVIVTGFKNKLNQFSENAYDAGVEDAYGVAHEVFVTRKQTKELEKLLGLEEGQFKSLRNAAAGCVNRLYRDKDNIADEIIKHLSFYPTMAAGLDMKHKDLRKFMLDHYAKVPSDMIAPVYIKGNKKELISKIKEYAESLVEKRFTLSYDIDGVVITVVKASHQDTLGRKGRKNKYQLAYKFEPNSAIGVLTAAFADVGAFGKATDKLMLEHPVVIQGVTYSFAHLLSAEDFDKLDPHKGDKVVIVRTADATPAVALEKSIALQTTKRGDKIARYNSCPYCGNLFVKNGKTRLCVNKDCLARRIGKITNILDILGVAGLSEGFAKKIVGIGVYTIEAMYNLTETDLFNLGYKSGCKRFIKEIQIAIEEMSAWDLIDALGIDQLRATRAKKILRVISINELVQKPYHDLVDSIRSVDNIDSMAERFASDLEKNQSLITRMLKVIDIKPDDNIKRSLICFSNMRPTKKEEKQLRKMGYEVTNNKTFDILVGDKLSEEKHAAYLKNQTTRKLMTSKEFYSWLEESENK